ncbi:MAG TPA: IS256 family transposase [Gemmatimonadales bacterium]|nr:IS256 family transposase [Gemmatimonadales bacterium]
MGKTSRKQIPREVVQEQRAVTVGEVLVDVGADLRELMVKGGLAIAAALFTEELAQLCGPRYERGEGLASRWGARQGEVVLGGRKVKLRRPRVRQDGHEVELETYRRLQAEDPLTERALEQMLVGVSTRKYARSLEPAPAGLTETATSKSAVSRRFVAKTQEQLEAALAQPLGDRTWLALLIDGIQLHEHVVLVVLGVDDTGDKHVLAFREGSTENATLCREMLADLVARGVPADRSLLVVIDGGKGLRKAVNDVFGQYAPVQRCQVHKKRNVLDHLPDQMRAQTRAALSEAYAAVSYELALAQLQNLARSLGKKQPSAASSLREGMEETLTVKKLGISGWLAKTLETTNPIENLNKGIRRVSARVDRCRSGAMALRWVATGALESARGFRRLKGHAQIGKLIAALRARDAELGAADVRRAG